MTILLLLVGLSIALLGVAIAAFVWAVRSGQFDDLDTPPLDVLREDTMAPPAATRDESASPAPAREQRMPRGAARTPRDEPPRGG
jgi:cbb3-type cytochrome oxidase maturation protein